MQAIYDRGYIYAGEFEALYCVGCEEFKTESEIVDGEGPFEGLKVCAIHSKPLELLQEKNYFFKLSEFQDRLLELYRTDFIRPESARNEVVSFVKQGLKDLSISRSTFDWGIKVPWDESHVIYVWVDALLNYATAVGYGSDPEEFARRWPAYHVVGKDILRFHAVIWPAMLMAAGVEVPRGVFAHGWLLVGGEKMSKSKLTGIAPTEITDVFGSDAYRFYFLSAIAFGQDGSFSWEDLSARYQAELANGFGNLASRTTAMIERYFEGVAAAARTSTPRPDLGDPADGGGCRGRRRRRDRALPHRRGDHVDLDDRRRAEPVHHRERAVGAREGRRAARATRHRAVHGGRGAAGARRAAVAGDADRDREAVDRARRRRDARPPRRPADPRGRRPGASCRPGRR